MIEPLTGQPTGSLLKEMNPPGYDADVEDPDAQDDDDQLSEAAEGESICCDIGSTGSEQASRQTHPTIKLVDSIPFRKRKRKAPAYHPDIDITLTKLLTSSEYEQMIKRRRRQQHQSSHPTTDSADSFVYDLNKLLKTYQQIYTDVNAWACSDSDRMSPDIGGKLTFSPQVRVLHDVMSMSRQPRVLFEAHTPFRAVHMNAAYLRSEMAACPPLTPTRPSMIHVMGEHTSAVVFAVQADVDKKITHYLVEMLPTTTLQVLG